MTGRTFAELHELEELYLAGNELRTIEPRALTSLKKLRTLDLSDNSLEVLHDSIFQVWQTPISFSKNVIPNFLFETPFCFRFFHFILLSLISYCFGLSLSFSLLGIRITFLWRFAFPYPQYAFLKIKVWGGLARSSGPKEMSVLNVMTPIWLMLSDNFQRLMQIWRRTADEMHKRLLKKTETCSSNRKDELYAANSTFTTHSFWSESVSTIRRSTCGLVEARTGISWLGRDRPASTRPVNSSVWSVTRNRR